MEGPDVWERDTAEIACNEHRACHMCGGYYGSNHSQPVCSTCHMFLFPAPNLDDHLELHPNPQIEATAKNDSEDSGTEEPLELEDDSAEAAGPLPSQHYGGYPVTLRQLPEAMLPPPQPKPSHSDRMRQRVRELSEYSSANGPSPICNLPPEVLLHVFNYLSDMGLHTASNVCRAWSDLVECEVTNYQWETFVRRRWPLFKPHFRVDSWRDIHSQLVASAPCHYCIENMRLVNTLPVFEESWRHRRLSSELKSLQNDPPEGILAVPLDDKCTFWQAMITGPRGSPYEGGKFFLYLQVPQSYPMQPPFVQFITKIFHPNVSRHGDIGLDSIHHNWSLALTLSKILLSIQSLLTDPYVKVCMEPAIAQCYQKNVKLYNQIARSWTWKYAMTDRQQVYLGVVNGSDGFMPFTSHSI